LASTPAGAITADFYDPAAKEGNLAAVRDRITLMRGDIRDACLVGKTFARLPKSG
jgi:hypothetical protein